MRFSLQPVKVIWIPRVEAAEHPAVFDTEEEEAG